MEFVKFFKEFLKYEKFGVKIFWGVIFFGFLGIGKIFFVKVIVGEVGVFFFFVFGFEFVEMFVGVGFFWVCDLFVNVKKNVLCIIFVDEIDVIGKFCGKGGNFGGNDECEFILN